MKTTTQTARTAEIHWHPCHEKNRAFLCLSGIDNNLAEVFPLETETFINAHDNARRMATQLNAFPDLLAALRETILLLQTTLFDLELRLEIDGYLTTRDHEKIPEFRRRIASSIAIVSNIDENRAAIAKATEGGE